MMFKASEIYEDKEIKNNQLIISNIQEVETIEGWKYGKDLKVGDKLINNDSNDIIITDIKLNNSNYIISF